MTNKYSFIVRPLLLALLVLGFGFFNLAMASTEIPLLTDSQLMTASDNGMIDAICFVTGLLTGNFARAVFALSTVALGWLFLIGEVKDHKPVFFFVLAICITLGATNIANILTGTDYSCEKIAEVTDKAQNSVYNKGECILGENEYYSSGQTWKVCSSQSNSACRNTVSSTTNITVTGANKLIALTDCQDGYFKVNKDTYLFFQCETGGVFRLLNTADKEAGKCVKGCSRTDLINLATRYNINFSTLTKVANSGQEEGSYYTQGYRIKGDCKTGYTEYDETGAKNADAIDIVCDSNGTFTLKGSCKKGCNIKTTTFNNSVLYWKKCDKDGVCTPTTNSNFDFGDVLEIDTCRSGYSLSTKNSTNARIRCSEYSSWVIEETTDKVTGATSQGNRCVKKCDLRTIESYDTAIFQTNVCESGSTNCEETEITSGQFENGDIVRIKECRSGYSTNYTEVNGIYTCNSDGKWELSKGTSPCYKSCNFNAIIGYNLIDRMTYCNMEDTACGEFNTMENNVPTGYVLKLTACKSGYSFDINYEPFTAICENGQFTFENKSNNCYPSCKYSDLLTMVDNNALTWYEVKKSGDIVIDGKKITRDTGTDQNGSAVADNGTYFSIGQCSTSFNKPQDDTIIVKCDNGTWRVSSNDTGICMQSCNNNQLFSLVKGLSSLIETNNSGKTVDNATEIELSTNPLRKPTSKNENDTSLPGAYYTITDCQDGYSIYNDRAATFRCYSGQWAATRNASYLCMPDCKNADIFTYLGSTVASIIETESNGDIPDNAKTFQTGDTTTLPAGTYVKIYKCSDGFRLIDDKSIVLECVNGGWKVSRNKDSLCTRI